MRGRMDLPHARGVGVKVVIGMTSDVEEMMEGKKTSAEIANDTLMMTILEMTTAIVDVRKSTNERSDIIAIEVTIDAAKVEAIAEIAAAAVGEGGRRSPRARIVGAIAVEVGVIAGIVQANDRSITIHHNRKLHNKKIFIG